MTLRFGTDGIRGRVGSVFSAGLARQVAYCAAQVLGVPSFFTGGDTRESSADLLAAAAAGLDEAGADVVALGVVPTPAVAYLAACHDAAGIVISASHNPWHDNGIKLFGPGGRKLSDDEQAEIEERLNSGGSAGGEKPIGCGPLPPTGASSASARLLIRSYVEAIKETAWIPFGGLKVVVDAANGAASHIVAPALADLGAHVVAMANEPDGQNINQGCGSTSPALLAHRVLEESADLGLAFDGDADRLLAVDSQGHIVDGDAVIGILAVALNNQGALAKKTVVVTVMSNLGFHRSMAESGIDVHVTDVGDRAVVRALDAHGFSFGGEQSGHLIFRDLATTGDGFLTAVQLISTVVHSATPLTELAAKALTRFPQVNKSVAVGRRINDIASLLEAEISEASLRLGEHGRVLVRASGTEPVIRVMVEAIDQETAIAECDGLCALVESRFG